MSKGGGGGGGDGGDANQFALLWIIAVAIILGFIVWHFWAEYFKFAFIEVKRFEIYLVSIVLDNANIQKAIYSLNIARPSDINLYYATKMSEFIGNYLKYPICFILFIMAVIMLRGSATMRYTKAYNMDTLAKQEKENWPQISPVVDLDLISMDVNKGPWAMSMNPMQFARHYKLLKVELVADRKNVWKTAGIPKATVIKERANQVFAAQLGPLWSGIDSLPPHTKALFAAFAARVEHDTDSCKGYLNNLSRSAAKGEMDYSNTEVLLKKYGNAKAVQLCISRHAYVSTVMASMLVIARTDGVLASADFLWVKPLDRRLWYTLCCVGRQVAVPEVGGVFAHWLAEKEMARPLTSPMVEEATKAFEIAINNTIYIPEEGEVIGQEVVPPTPASE